MRVREQLILTVMSAGDYLYSVGWRVRFVTFAVRCRENYLLKNDFFLLNSFIIKTFFFRKIIICLSFYSEGLHLY